MPSKGSLQVSSSQPGLVSRSLVKVGEKVIEGQVLFEITSQRIVMDGDVGQMVDAAINTRRELLKKEINLRIEQSSFTVQAIEQEIASIVSESDQLEVEIELQTKRIEDSNRTLDYYMKLKREGFVSELQLLQRSNELKEQQARLNNLKRTSIKLSRESALKHDEISRAKSDLKIRELQSSQALIAAGREQTENNSRSKNIIVSPANGIISSLGVESGQFINGQHPLAYIIPENSEYEAHLSIPSRAVGLIKSGQTVFLRLAAFPYQKFGMIRGKIIRLETSPFSSATATEQKTQANGKHIEPEYKIVVRIEKQTMQLDGHMFELKTGMTLEADVLQEKRSIFEWLIAPLINHSTLQAV